MDLPEEFLCIPNEHDVIMTDKKTCKINGNYCTTNLSEINYHKKEVEPVLYIWMQKAVYGMLKSALLFWKNLETVFLSLTRVIHVTNKAIEG